MAEEIRYDADLVPVPAQVQGDLDGEGTADFWIRVDELHNVVSSDFIL